MPSETFLTGCIKIHAGCGGQVRCVESLDKRAVEWEYECLGCGSEHLVNEDTIHLYDDDLPGDLTKRDVVETPEPDLAELEWSETWRSYEDAVEGGLLDQVAEVIE